MDFFCIKFWIPCFIFLPLHSSVLLGVGSSHNIPLKLHRRKQSQRHALSLSKLRPITEHKEMWKNIPWNHILQCVVTKTCLSGDWPKTAVSLKAQAGLHLSLVHITVVKLDHAESHTRTQNTVGARKVSLESFHVPVVCVWVTRITLTNESRCLAYY